MNFWGNVMSKPTRLPLGFGNPLIRNQTCYHLKWPTRDRKQWGSVNIKNTCDTARDQQLIIPNECMSPSSVQNL